MDSIFQEESLLILTAMVISFSLVCGMKMCADNETFFQTQSTSESRIFISRIIIFK